ncbi:helix-turn-helix domain-containing protein [Ancylobacter rudongensis]|uniref:DnaA protein helix-turn-helix n=1 Tax=Ancylobacter rudongensis TaxID=177413 RepID=A0A1G4TD03_9HYPH|nr:helix-turn-helix domain-containing protein [Ancylobacter rudongensis]SCW79280.1 dnaA protein helix-turn-helix [Ancylobacter rudongensis]
MPDPLALSTQARPAAETCLIAARLAADATAIPLPLVLHPRRLDRRCASARALAMYLAHVGLGLPMSRVAAGFGRHRSTVAHACRRIEERRESAGWDRWVAALEDDARRLSPPVGAVGIGAGGIHG